MIDGYNSLTVGVYILPDQIVQFNSRLVVGLGHLPHNVSSRGRERGKTKIVVHLKRGASLARIYMDYYSGDRLRCQITCKLLSKWGINYVILKFRRSHCTMRYTQKSLDEIASDGSTEQLDQLR
jgi:hypothetical protein